MQWSSAAAPAAQSSVSVEKRKEEEGHFLLLY
jgi:hypothetical protein